MSRRRHRRSALALALLVGALAAGCVSVRSSPEPSADPEPSVRSVVDGIETWDRTGAPTRETLGFADGADQRIFEESDPRRIVLLLPGDVELSLRAKVLIFLQRDAGAGEGFSFSVRGATLEPAELRDDMVAVVDALGLPTSGVEDYIEAVRAAPTEQTERIRYSSPTAELDDLTIGVGANVAPIARAGRQIVGAAWGADATEVPPT